jgi:transcriptional regulator GlxA family with amidase domain
MKIPHAFVSGILLLASACVVAEEQPTERDPSQPKKVTVAVLIFDGVELLDFAGPAEVFIVASQQHPFRVFTVGPSRDPIKTMGGITVTPEFGYENAPKADVLVVPGGNTRGAGAAGVKWIRDSAEDAEIVMSVCFGALLLAEAKLLDGATATTHNWAIDSLKAAAPKCKVVTGQRFVDSGKIVTTAGVTAGIDGAIHVVERIAGKKVAHWTAETWMEYKRPGKAKD